MRRRGRVMGKKKRTLPTVKHGEEYLFRPRFEEGNFSLVSLGRSRYANELSYGYLDSGWRNVLEPCAPPHLTDKNWISIERVLERYIFNRASELGAIPWTDAIGALERIAKGAAELLAASDAGNAGSFIWERIEAVGDTPFNRNDFYPLLSALNHRAHLLRAAMNAERERGDQLSIFAFRRFVLDIANFYDTIGGDVKVSKINDSNRDVHPTRFSTFAWEAMKQIPEKLRQHCSNPNGWSFFDALDEQVRLLPEIGALKKNTRHTSPTTNSGQRR
jgi:hypothetical protein